jgi:hypothetical protein
MSFSRIPEAVKRIFTETFTARDIAEPLVSYDGTTSFAAARAVMVARGFDVVGVRKEGQVAGYVEKDSVKDGRPRRPSSGWNSYATTSPTPRTS